MIPSVRDWSMGARIAGVSLLVALTLDVIALMRLRTLRDEIHVAPLALRPVPRIVTHAPNDADMIRAAINRAPFGAETEASFVPPTIVQQSESAAPPRPRLVGTVVEGRDGGFVIVELPDARMQLVRIGERAGGLRLRSVTAGEAVFDDAHGGRVSLRTPSPGSESRP